MKLPDWYTPQMFALDQALKGVWWRCPRHGVLSDPVVLGGDVAGRASAYCAEPECVERVLLVSRAGSSEGGAIEKKDGTWSHRRRNDETRRYRPRGEVASVILEVWRAAGRRELATREIAQLVVRSSGSCSEDDARHAVLTLERRGQVIRVRRGVWRLR